MPERNGIRYDRPCHMGGERIMKTFKKRLKSDLWIVLLDIIAVNGAYLMALLIRFYINFHFTSNVGDFRQYYLQFTPYYTVICLVVFYICGLYDGMWRYAGLDDMNKVILASVITAIIHVVGTKLFVHAMPTSYYIIGAFLQFLMIVVIRFSYRFLIERKQHVEKKRAWSVPAMVVGSGDCGRKFIQYLEDNTPFQVVVVAGDNIGKSMNGIPIVDYKTISAQIQYNNIKAVFIADDRLSDEQKTQIRKAANKVEVRDYTDLLSDIHGAVTPESLLSLIDGPLIVVKDGTEQRFNSGNECIAMLNGKYEVEKVSGAKIELRSIS